MKKLKAILAIQAVSFLTPMLASAEVKEASDVIRVMEKIANWIFTIFLMAAVIAILVAGFKFLNASSSPEKASEAKRMLAYAAVAIAVALMANAIPFIMQQVIK